MPRHIPVCKDWNGDKNEIVDFINEGTRAVVLKKGDTEWPFTTGPDLTVPAKKDGGLLQVQLKDLKDGTYIYRTIGCDDLGQSKSVTIP